MAARAVGRVVTRMALELIPDNQEILAILQQSIRGSYRFVHHALVPYVRIGPATETEPITITPSASLRLAPSVPKTVQGRAQTVDLAVVLMPYLHLVEVTLLPPRRQALAQKALQALEDA